MDRYSNVQTTSHATPRVRFIVMRGTTGLTTVQASSEGRPVHSAKHRSPSGDMPLACARRSYTGKFCNSLAPRRGVGKSAGGCECVIVNFPSCLRKNPREWFPAPPTRRCHYTLVTRTKRTEKCRTVRFDSSIIPTPLYFCNLTERPTIARCGVRQQSQLCPCSTYLNTRTSGCTRSRSPSTLSTTGSANLSSTWAKRCTRCRASAWRRPKSTCTNA
jgi:hypothetical protein